MKYWLLSAYIHSTDIQPSLMGRPWDYPKVSLDERFKGGDIVYLSFGGDGLYGWGTVIKREKYKDDDMGEAFKAVITRPVIRQGLVTRERISQTKELEGVFSFPSGNLVLLTVAQIKELNKLIRMQGEESPPDPSDLDEQSLYEILHAGRSKVVPTFIHNTPLDFDETRYIEFKEVLGQNPVGSIKNTADEYAVALLNNEGGRVFWGVRNSDRVVVGLKLTYTQRDDVRREVTSKLATIQPATAIQEFSVELHPVKDEKGESIPDLYVVELDVPRGSPTRLYATGNHEVWMKTDAGKQRLTHEQVMTEILRRTGR